VGGGCEVQFVDQVVHVYLEALGAEQVHGVGEAAGKASDLVGDLPLDVHRGRLQGAFEDETRLTRRNPVGEPVGEPPVLTRSLLTWTGTRRR
jgi:hypothetical protein